MRKIALLIAAFGFLLINLAACGNRRNAEEERPKVMVSIEPLRCLTEQIAGDYFQVETMVPKGGSPETYEPSPRQMMHLQESKVYLAVGDLGFEKTWLDKFKENAPDVSFVNTSGRQAANADPHVWTSYRRLIKMAGVICEALCDADPEYQEYFKANLKKTVSSLEAADQEVQRELQSVRQRAFLIYHPTLTYFAEDYGLMQIAIENEGKEPSPQRLAELIEQCRKENVGVIFIQEEFDRKNAELIARETRTQLVSINPLAYDYDKELRQIAKILSKQ